MKTIIKMSLSAAAAAILLTACTPPAGNSNSYVSNANANANSNAAARTAAPTKDELVQLETKAFEAWKNKDGKFFEGFIAQNFVGFDPKGNRVDRAATIKMITEDKCEVKSFSFADERVTPVTADVAVLTLKATGDYTCEGKPGPSPVISSTVYVREGAAWKAAYHNEVPVVDPKNAKAAPAKPSPAAANANTAAAAPAPAADPATDPLMAAAKSGWEAWKARDAKKLGEMSTNDVAFVDIMGNVTTTKADTLKAWTEPKCEIKSVAVTDGKTTTLTKDVSILTHKGTAEGTCEGQPLGPVWATAVFVKEGDAWKIAYLFETSA